MNSSRPSILPLTHVYSSASGAWLDLVSDILRAGHVVEPRGRRTRELIASSRTFDMRYPVVNTIGRRLGYRFMTAEAAWIMGGQDDVASIAPYSKEVSRFSDDGVSFFGAYGPKIKEQLPYIVNALTGDRDSRQAVINIWRETPPRTRDVPCTLSLQFLIRGDHLHCIANMRSSDVWLGWPYDVFNFTMVSAGVLGRVNDLVDKTVSLGTLTLRAGSQHLYDSNAEQAVAALSYENQQLEGPVAPFVPTFSSWDKQVRELWAVAKTVRVPEYIRTQQRVQQGVRGWDFDDTLWSVIGMIDARGGDKE